ncbi:unnamed protein product [Amoebophrya sp. A25]|nr:unnamed protein product [Amoebophrya sp. A25]|eukprot:GSA25T00022848001.1
MDRSNVVPASLLLVLAEEYTASRGLAFSISCSVITLGFFYFARLPPQSIHWEKDRQTRQILASTASATCCIIFLACSCTTYVTCV